MKTEFTYRMHRRRNALALAGVIILVPLQLKLTVMIQEKYYMAVILITILLYEFIFYYVTRNRFLQKGYYKCENDKLEIYLQKIHDIDIKHIRKIECFQKKGFGEEYLVFKIQSDKYRNTIVIPEFVEEQKYQAFYQLYNSIEKYDYFKSNKIDENYWELVNCGSNIGGKIPPIKYEI